MANTPTVQASGHSVAEWTWFSIGIAALVIFLCNLIMACCRRILNRRRQTVGRLISGEKLFDDKFLLQLSKQISADWWQLAIRLGFYQHELITIRADVHEVVEQCRQMLVAWRRKQTSNKTATKQMLKAVKEINRKDLAMTIEEEIKTKTRRCDPEQHAFENCKEALKGLYRTTGSYVQILPWVGDDSIHIMDIYTELELVMTSDDEDGKIVSYEHIFHKETREGCPINRVILNGRAHQGKSTLLGKIAYDWASGSEELRKFELIFLLKMNSLKPESDLIDALFDQLLDQNDIDKDNLRRFIFDNSDRVLFIFDGFDDFKTNELDPKKFGSILQMLNRKGEYKNCHVIVTTRPSHFDKLVTKVLIQRPFIKVDVLEFKQEAIQFFVEKFYSKHPDKAIELTETIQSSGILSSLAKSPMMLLLICLLWRNDATLPATMSRFYSDAMEYILKMKHVDISDHDVSDVVKSIGKIALDGLVSHSERLTFTESEFSYNRAFAVAKDAGILISEMVVMGIHNHMSIQFIHETFQEFCAAAYCRSLFQDDMGKFQEILKHIDDPCRNEFFLRFCCGDNEPVTSKILHLLLNQAVDLNDKIVKLALNCYFESQCDAVPAVILEVVLREDLIIQRFSSEHLMSYMYSLKQVNDHENTGNSCFTIVRKLTIEDTNLHLLGSDFEKYVSKMTNLTYMSISNCLIHSLCIKSSLANKEHLTELKIDGESLGSCAVLLYSRIEALQHLQKVALTGCELIGKDIEQISEALCDLTNLRELDLSRNATLAGCTKSWSHLTKMKQLTKLSLDSCLLIGEDVRHIAVSLSDMPKLVELDLSWNVTLGSSGTSWSFLTKTKYPNLNLRLEKAEKDVKDTALALRKLASGVGLGRSCSVTYGGSKTKWSYLSKMQHLKKLNLGLCSLTGQDLIDIAVAISNMHHLVELDLSYNVALAGSGESWSHLTKMTYIRKLILRFCSLKEEDNEEIAKAFSQMPNLELDLCENEAIRGSGEPLVENETPEI